MKAYDIIVVGAGPAGVGAALQSSINGLDVLLLEREEVGGRIRLARRIENLLLDRVIDGRTAAEYLREIIIRRGIRLVKEEAKRIVCSNNGYVVYTDRGRYHSKAIVLATGIVPKVPEIKGIEELQQRGRVFYRWSDLRRGIDSPVLIIGAGEVGCDSACSLIENGFDVTIFSRSEILSVNSGLLRDLRALHVKLVRGVVYNEVCESQGESVLVVKKKGRILRFRGKSILVTIGGEPDLKLLNGISNTERILICGDANPSNFRQASIAFGDGVNGAMRLTRVLYGR